MVSKVGDGTGHGAMPPKVNAPTARPHGPTSGSGETQSFENAKGPVLAKPGNRMSPRGAK